MWPDAACGFVSKITDFGCLRYADSTMRTTRKQTGAATLAYKAPECFDDEPFSAASEVYAFGIVAWEVLTGGMPWEGFSEARLTKAMIKEERPPLPAELAAVPSGQMVQRCWAQEPKARPAFAQLATGLGTALQAAQQAGLPPSSELPSTWSPVKDRLTAELVDLTADSTERAAVEAAFRKTAGSSITVLGAAGAARGLQHKAKEEAVLMREGSGATQKYVKR